MTTDLEKGDRAAELIYLIPCDHQKRVCFSSRWRWGDLVEILGKRRDDVFVQVLDVAGIVGANYSGWREENQDSGDGTASLTASSEGGILVYCRWSEVAPLRKELAKAGYEEVSVYGLSPGVNDPRLAVPVSTNKISAGALVLYQPSLRRAKLRKLAAYGMSRLGLTRVWAPVAMVAGRTGGASGGGIVSVVRREMGAMASIALFTGTPGPQRKATFAILGPRGEALGFGKIASTPATRALIRNEVKMLRRLETAGMGPEQVPRLLVEGRLEDGAEFVIQSTVKKPLVARTTRIGDVQARFLVDLFERTKAVDPDRGRAIFEDLSGRVGRLAACEAGRGRELVRQGLAQSASCLDFGRIPVVLAHGDFTAWNSFPTHHGLFVFDWELGREAWYPMADAFHYVIQKCLFVERRSARELFARMVQHDHSPEGRGIHRLLGEMALPKELLMPLLILYLCDVYTAYATRTEAGGEKSDRDVKRLLDFWLGMLEQAVEAEVVGAAA